MLPPVAAVTNIILYQQINRNKQMILNFKNVENALKIEREKHINVKKYNFQHISREKQTKMQ